MLKQFKLCGAYKPETRTMRIMCVYKCIFSMARERERREIQGLSWANSIGSNKKKSFQFLKRNNGTINQGCVVMLRVKVNMKVTSKTLLVALGGSIS